MADRRPSSCTSTSATWQEEGEEEAALPPCSSDSSIESIVTPPVASATAGAFTYNIVTSSAARRAGAVRFTRMPVAAPVAAPALELKPAAPVADGPDLTNAITSPMVGTVYLAPEPGAGNFVSPGDEVSEGQTLVIIEAMKTMNAIPAPRSGRVRAIMVENAEPVEFGEPLMIIE